MLETLYQTCQKVLENHDLASHLLPTYQEFFYGSYDYDDYYFDYVEYTAYQVHDILKRYDKESTFIYWVWW